MKPIRLPSELAYLLALMILSLSVAMTAAADFGVSMIVAPAYILSLKLPVFTFGQAEYIVQGVLFIVFCILMRRVRWVYFVSFATGLLYGAILDLWRFIIPHFAPAATGTMGMPLRIVYLALGLVMTSFAVAMLFRVYIYPQVYDFFVKGIAARYKLNRTRFKQGFDAVCLLVSVAMSVLLFGRLEGIGLGTVAATVFNGAMIGGFDRLIGKVFSVEPLFPRAAAIFEKDIDM